MKHQQHFPAYRIWWASVAICMLAAATSIAMEDVAAAIAWLVDAWYAGVVASGYAPNRNDALLIAAGRKRRG